MTASTPGQPITLADAAVLQHVANAVTAEADWLQQSSGPGRNALADSLRRIAVRLDAPLEEYRQAARRTGETR